MIDRTAPEIVLRANGAPFPATGHLFLDDVEITPYPATVSVSTEELKADAQSLPGIRLLDPALVSDTFEQLQQVRAFLCANLLEPLGGIELAVVPAIVRPDERLDRAHRGNRASGGVLRFDLASDLTHPGAHGPLVSRVQDRIQVRADPRPRGGTGEHLQGVAGRGRVGGCRRGWSRC